MEYTSRKGKNCLTSLLSKLEKIEIESEQGEEVDQRGKQAGDGSGRNERTAQA